ncbi:MAG: hypothetical protein IJL24_06815 [Treponema sp.]|nr:hypothetical protein [Treponema sp.]
MQWEYEILHISNGYELNSYAYKNPNATDYVDTHDINKSIQNLNKWGAVGWEIAGVSSDQYGYGYIYLKRPKASTN